MEGSGVMMWKDKRKYTGGFKDDHRHGWGTMEWPDGKKYEGEWSDGKQNGIGQFDKNGKVKFGRWENGIK